MEYLCLSNDSKTQTKKKNPNLVQHGSSNDTTYACTSIISKAQYVSAYALMYLRGCKLEVREFNRILDIHISFETRN